MGCSELLRYLTRTLWWTRADFRQVYRNRDAGAARRGLKKLEKHWEDDGETLRRVQDGTLA